VRGATYPFSAAEAVLLKRLAYTDWHSSALTLTVPEDREVAAQAAALGAILCHGFANFYAISAHPHPRVVRAVNLAKGRPPQQVGSLTTTRERMDRLFDWAQLPPPLHPAQVQAVMDDFYTRGPFGFLGPAAPDIPDHLVQVEAGQRTTQLIAPGYGCLSNPLLARVLELTEQDYLFITSANRSHATTGRAEEPAHYRMEGIQADFGHCAGFVMVAHPDEPAIQAAFPEYLPMSTSILSFHRPAEVEGRPALTVERHGSLSIAEIAALLDAHGLGVVIRPHAQQRLSVRKYSGIHPRASQKIA
jgi:hypothetical protein